MKGFRYSTNDGGFALHTFQRWRYRDEIVRVAQIRSFMDGAVGASYVEFYSTWVFAQGPQADVLENGPRKTADSVSLGCTVDWDKEAGLCLVRFTQFASVALCPIVPCEGGSHGDFAVVLHIDEPIRICFVQTNDSEAQLHRRSREGVKCVILVIGAQQNRRFRLVGLFDCIALEQHGNPSFTISPVSELYVLEKLVLLEKAPDFVDIEP